MSLGKARKVLCFILTVLIAVGSVLLFGSLLIKGTVLSQQYMNKVFAVCNVSEQCKNNFKDQIEVLEAKSGIPARVFDAVYNTDSIDITQVTERLFSGSDTSLYSKDEISNFEDLCKEYLEGNNLSYDEELVHNTALEAAQIYSDCFGMENTAAFFSFVTDMNDNMAKYISVGLLLMLFCIAMLFLLYTKAFDIMFNIFAALTLSGLTFILTGIGGLVFKLWQHTGIAPTVYYNAVASCVKGMCAIGIIFGVILTAVSVFVNIKIIREKDKRNEH